MKSYPYIGELKSGSGGIAIFASEESAAKLNLEGKNWERSDTYLYSDEWDEGSFKNITAEYLANTYGEVKNKEHAEFIVKLAEVNGFDIGIKSNTPSVFEFSGMLLNIYANDISSFAHNVESKQITIPLPPECEEKIYRYEGMGHKPKHFNCVCTKCGGRCCIGSCDEWPKVGSKVTWGNKAVNGEVKGIDNGLAWIKNDHGNYVTAYISELEKPKTPEQELREEISDLAFNQFNDDSYDLTHNSYYLAEQLISKYNITKKGEGDE